MARRIFISFLGTGRYKPCQYVTDDYKSEIVYYVQEALVRRTCAEWNKDDRAFIILTDDAKAKNWEHNAANKESAGLRVVLEQIGLKAKVETVSIPDFNSEQGIWELFQTLYELFDEEDEVYFDITHSFRFLPMLMNVLLSYTKVLKRIKVMSISYGNFEALGPAYTIDERIPNPRDRKAPIVELVDFSQLQDWTQATREFLRYGRGEAFSSMVRSNVGQFFKTGETGKGKLYAALARQTKEMTQLFLANRGLSIQAGQVFENLQKTIGALEQLDDIKPIRPLFSRIKSSTNKFKPGSWKNGIHAARWCIDHELIQQGYTLLQESICSYVTTLHGELDSTKQEDRELASDALNISSHSYPRDTWKTENPKVVEVLVELIPKELISAYSSLTSLRNDINHAGFRNNPANFESLRNKLEKNYCNVVSALFE